MKKSNNEIKISRDSELIQEEEKKLEQYDRMLRGDLDAIVDILFEGGRCTKDDRDYYYNVLKNNKV